MSLFKSERATLSRITLAQDVIPAASVPGELQIQNGDLWNDSVQNALGFRSKGLTSYLMSAPATNVTVVTATNPNATADLMTLTLPAGMINQLGKTLYVYGAGTYTTAAGQTPTITIASQFGSVVAASAITAATNNSVTDSPWEYSGFITTQLAGASGKVEAHCALDCTIGAGGAIATARYLDVNAAVSSAMDMTGALTLKLTGLMSSADAGNNIKQRMFIAYLIN